ncbi:MAG: MOSC N-terminal beta barrel domain-containing protein [Chloroflexi bacterium]|nr:MOSC N-terminal beta barrel domain-containing protein [Chloroflexota bacterium]
MLRVTGLYTYPIKSCGGLSHDAVDLLVRGLRDDRRWLIITPDGQFVTQRENAKLALIQPAYADGMLQISAPGHEPVRVSLDADADGVATRRVVVWKSTCDAVDQGDTIAAWLSDFLGQSVRLVKQADADGRLTSNSHTDQPAPVSFADGYPLLLANSASLADLNDRLLARDKDTLLMNRFRPNVVIDGAAAWAEDGWTRLLIGGVPFDSVKPCARCEITTIDQATATVPDYQEPLATLATFRKQPKGVMFGQNIIHRAVGALHIGDRVEVVA